MIAKNIFKLIVLSLCDGMSCGQQALIRAGIMYHKYYASEIDKYAKLVTQTRFPGTIQVGDMRDLDPKDFKDVNLIIAGTPCQSISLAGKIKGIRTEDGILITSLDHYLQLKSMGKEFTESALFWEFVRMYEGIKKYNPKVKFLLENVTNKEWEKYITKVLGVPAIRINSSEVIPQNRERNYWSNILYTPTETKYRTLGDVIPGAVSGAGSRGTWKPEVEKYVQKITIRPDSIANCLTKAGSTRMYNDIEGYLYDITPEEAEVLQTVEVGFTDVPGVSKTQRFNMLGNGWTIDVIVNFFKNL